MPRKHDTRPAPGAPNMLDPAFIADPYPTLGQVRESVGTTRDALGIQYYVTRHDDVDEVLRDRRFAVDPRKADPGTAHYLLEMSRAAGPSVETDEARTMLFLDPPDHTRLRGLVSRAFTPRAVEALRGRIQATANALLAAVNGATEFDLMEALAQPLPTIVIAEMLGVDPDRRQEFKAWSDALVWTLDPFASQERKEAAIAASEALRQLFAEEIQNRRASPRDDLVSRLIAAQEYGDSLTDAEMIGTCSLLLTAGNVTTTDLIGNGVFALLQHPDQLGRLQANPSLIAHAVEEMLRFDSPVVETARVSMEDVTITDCTIRARQSVAPSLAAANRDPRAYPEPDQFDITRTDVHHHSFGGGPHYCLGAPLARLEAQIAIGTLVQQFPKLRLVPGFEPQRRLLPGFRGLVSLRVHVD